MNTQCQMPAGDEKLGICFDDHAVWVRERGVLTPENVLDYFRNSPFWEVLMPAHRNLQALSFLLSCMLCSTVLYVGCERTYFEILPICLIRRTATTRSVSPREFLQLQRRYLQWEVALNSQ